MHTVVRSNSSGYPRSLIYSLIFLSLNRDSGVFATRAPRRSASRARRVYHLMVASGLMLAAAAAQTVAAVDDPLRELTRARAQLAGGRAYVLRPRKTVRPGGNLDDPNTLPRVLPAAAADGEVMLLCVGGEGALRTGAGLVLNMRSLGLYHMLLLAPERRVCERMWEAFASVACVWWPSKILHTHRPESLYNTRFSPLALAIFEARKVLLERMVLEYRLNVLHLDADSVCGAQRPTPQESPRTAPLSRARSRVARRCGLPTRTLSSRA